MWGAGGKVGRYPKDVDPGYFRGCSIFFWIPRGSSWWELVGYSFFVWIPDCCVLCGFWGTQIFFGCSMFFWMRPSAPQVFFGVHPLPLKIFLSTPLCPLPQPSPSARMMWNRRCLFKFLCLKITWATLSREPTWEAQVRAPTEFSLGPDISSSESNMYVKW